MARIRVRRRESESRGDAVARRVARLAGGDAPAPAVKVARPARSLPEGEPTVDPTAPLEVYLAQSLARVEWLCSYCAREGRISEFSALQGRALDWVERLQAVKPVRRGLFELPADERTRRLVEALRYWPLEVLEAAAVELERRRHVVDAT